MYSIQVTGRNDKSLSYLKKDNLSALIDHESNTVRQTVASTSNVPARVDHVDLGLDLIWMEWTTLIARSLVVYVMYRVSQKMYHLDIFILDS